MQIQFFYDVMFDYLRAVLYAVVILTDLHGIAHRKFDSLLYLGDTVLAFGLLVASFNMGMSVFNIRYFADVVLTPAALIWAGIHYYEFIKKT